MVGLWRGSTRAGDDAAKRRERRRGGDSEPGPCAGLSSPEAKQQLWEDSIPRAVSVPHLAFSALESHRASQPSTCPVTDPPQNPPASSTAA